MEQERARALEYMGHTRSFGRLATGLVYFQQNRRQRRDQRYHDFVGFWEEAQTLAVWGQLRQRLQSHLTSAEPSPAEPSPVEPPPAPSSPPMEAQA
jgi:hypothetical protein